MDQIFIDDDVTRWVCELSFDITISRNGEQLRLAFPDRALMNRTFLDARQFRDRVNLETFCRDDSMVITPLDYVRE